MPKSEPGGLICGFGLMCPVIIFSHDSFVPGEIFGCNFCYLCLYAFPFTIFPDVNIGVHGHPCNLFSFTLKYVFIFRMNKRNVAEYLDILIAVVPILKSIKAMRPTREIIAPVYRSAVTCYAHKILMNDFVMRGGIIGNKIVNEFRIELF